MVSERESLGAYFSRGLVIILMVYGHIDYVGSLSYHQDALHNILHSFRMPVLIFISAYFLNISGGYEVAFKKALKLIFIPYLLFESFYVGVHFLVNYIGLVDTNTKAVASLDEFFWTLVRNPTGPFWFLYYLSLVQFSVALAKLVSSVSEDVNPYLVIVSFLFLLSYSELVTFDFVIFYVLGMFFRASLAGLGSSVLFSSVFVILFALLGAASTDSAYLLRIPFVLSLVFLFVWVGWVFRGLWVVRVVSFVGANSMSVLCWHAFIIVVFRPFSDRFLIVDPSGVLYSISVTFIGVLLSIILTKCTDYVGVSKYVFGSSVASKAIKKV